MQEEVAIIALVIVLFVIPFVITILKGKYGLAALGVLFHPCWWFGALRLAKPESFWARYMYDRHKMCLAEARFCGLPQLAE